jgi:hypothetical protein
MFLMANGYQPSDVEQLVLGAPILVNDSPNAALDDEDVADPAD